MNILKIKFYNELPQWITSSDIAAYHPSSRTIYIKKRLGSKLPKILIHELTHWLIDILRLPEILHNKLDGKN